MNDMLDDDHDVFRDDLVAFADGELAPSRDLAVRMHLGECAGCRSELQGLEGFGRLLRAYRPETLASQDFERSFSAAFRREARARSVPPRSAPEPLPLRPPRPDNAFAWLMRPVMVPLSVATMAAAATLFFHPGSSDVTTPSPVGEVAAPAPMPAADSLVELVAEGEEPTPAPGAAQEPPPVIAEKTSGSSAPAVAVREDAAIVESAAPNGAALEGELAAP